MRKILCCLLAFGISLILLCACETEPEQKKPTGSESGDISNGSENDAPPPKNEANIPTVVKKLLTEYNYEGPFTIEREISGDQQTADIIHAKKLIEDAMATV